MAGSLATAAPVRDLIVTNDLRLPPGDHAIRLIVRGSHITIEGRGAVLVGPGETGDTNSLAVAGVGVAVDGVAGVTLKNVTVRGFAIGLQMRDATAISVSECDFSDNYHNPGHGWGELPARGGILCERVTQSTFLKNRASRVWDGLNLVDSDDNLIKDNDFSHCSNTAVKLWHSSRNHFLENNLSYGIRIDRSAGEVHARDSTGVLIETGSNDNYWFRNDVTYGGDGIFIRPLNRWVSRGNIFVENDTSFANNNCVESWSPGNVFIRNRANHGSYGFWLGGSDQTVLIGNEAAFNGLTNGNHNAPEPGFGHGGIVLVGGSSSHTRIEGNDVHDNNGAGIAFRGDVASRGRAWKTEHWVVQQNRIYNNRYGWWGRWGDGIVVAANVLTNNSQGNYLTNVSNWIELNGGSEAHAIPEIGIVGPNRALVGEPVRFRADRTVDGWGKALAFHWWLEGEAGREAALERVFDRPGFYRLGLTVDNGGRAALSWKDLIIVQPVREELGTERQAHRWGYELEGNSDGKSEILFTDDVESIFGSASLRFSPNPYPGAYATAIYPKTRDAHWDFSARNEVRFWIKAQNPNLPGFQNAGPVIRLLGPHGHIELKPVKEGNLLNDPPWSEGRWSWIPIVIPLAGSDQWQRTVQGDCRLSQIDALSIALDSWGGDPFNVWLDGLAVE